MSSDGWEEGFFCYFKEFGFYLVSNGKLLKDFKESNFYLYFKIIIWVISWRRSKGGSIGCGSLRWEVNVVF